MSDTPHQFFAAQREGNRAAEATALGAEMVTLRAVRTTPQWHAMPTEDRRVHDARIADLAARIAALRT